MYAAEGEITLLMAGIGIHLRNPAVDGLVLFM